MRDTNQSYKSYLLSVLLTILAFNYVDRTALGLVLQDIKIDLDLTDSQLGFLSGVAFALFYSVLGIPIARWADRGNRVTIIAVTTALWSAAVALCGVVHGFLQLMLIRILVGVGEAGCVPPAHSLIADNFSRAERPRAVSMYMQGISVSLVIGYLVAGWLNQFYGWRVMFMMIGIPGIPLAALAWFTLREPRQASGAPLMTSIDPPSLKEVCTTLWASKTFRHLLYAYSVFYFFTYGGFNWTPAFFVRSFGLKSGELGTWFAGIYGISGFLGTYLGGEWAVRYAAHNERLQLRVMAGMSCVAGILGAFVYLPSLAPNHYWAFGWLALASVASLVINGPVFAVMQTLVPARMRALSIAILYLFANLIGMGFGPWATGALSDALRPWLGQDGLRYALVALTPGYFWVAWHFWKAGKTVTDELATVLVDAERAKHDRPLLLCDSP